MLGHAPFYFASLRKLTVVFGDLFNDIKIQRMDSSNVVLKTIKVPLAYAPKQHYIVKLKELLSGGGTIDDSGITTNLRKTLPRMSYEMTGISYDADRKINPMNYDSTQYPTSGVYYKQFSPVPYIVSFDLNLWTETIDDSLQIIEQILPYFNPSITATINEISELNSKIDTHIKLNSITPNISNDGSLQTDNRIVEWNLNFEAPIRFYPAIDNSEVIMKAIANIDTNFDNVFDETITESVTPATALFTDLWTTTETIT